MGTRIFNFNPGPSTLPLPVLEKVREELLDYRGTGMSIMEMSHRSPEYEEINTTAETLTRKLMGLDESYHVLFLGGGASTQFAMIPLNFLRKAGRAAYADTGSWSSKAIKEAKRYGDVHLAASSKDKSYTYIPDVGSFDVPSDASYLHVTSNNTIFGTQYHDYPEATVPLVCDMSSDVCSRRLDFGRFSLIYAGAQKNLGPAGVTLVVVKEDFLEHANTDVPTLWSYRTHAENHSLYNTPPAFAVYVTKLVLEWIDGQGGLAAIEATNREKKDRLYRYMDAHADFYRGTVQPESRSWMNVTLRLPSEELEKRFIAEAKAARLGGLKGHRSVGGVRVSLYNAMTLEGVDALLAFMASFAGAA